MLFKLQPPFIIFLDERPGNEAMLLGPGNKSFPHRGDVSQFDDQKHRYVWVFEGTLEPGDAITFVTTDRRIYGKVRSYGVEIEGEIAIAKTIPPVSRPMRRRTGR